MTRFSADGRVLTEQHTQRNQAGQTVQRPFDGLTPREEEVLQWVVQGKSNGDIAIILGVALRTVKKHLERVFAKLNIHSRFEVIACYYEMTHERSREIKGRHTPKAVWPHHDRDARIDEGVGVR